MGVDDTACVLAVWLGMYCSARQCACVQCAAGAKAGNPRLGASCRRRVCRLAWLAAVVLALRRPITIRRFLLVDVTGLVFGWLQCIISVQGCHVHV